MGIDFSVNANASGADSELLDDYERGTWTANFRSHSNGTETTPNNHNTTTQDTAAEYVKIGRLVFVSAWINVQNLNNHIFYDCQGLPFASAAGSGSIAMATPHLRGIRFGYGATYIEDKMTEFIINEYSADVNILLKGRTPLHSAIHNSDSDRSNFNKIKMLLDNGANVNAQIEHYDFDDEDDEDYEDDGKTALHLAIDDNWIEVIKMLLENDKLNLNVKDSYGETPIDLAFKYHNIEVIKLLLVASLNQINTKISEKKDEDALKYAIEKLEQIKTSITIE